MITMIEIQRVADEIEGRLVATRRDVHKYAESGWTEFRTASLVARRLAELGYRVQAGREVVAAEARMGLPPPEVLEGHWQRARKEGGDAEYLEILRGGYTGVVGSLSHGPGPVVALRFDIDALDLVESAAAEHRPAREGFASVHAGMAHACGHDGHVAIGLGVAEVLARLRDEVRGTVKLVFQPAEEGVRGARAMVAAGVMDGVDYLLGQHLYSGWQLGAVDPGRGNYLATTKFDATLIGVPAHAGDRPNEGKNALLAAAGAVLNLHAIARHKDGTTRINVGRLTAGTGRNVVPDRAHLAIETRGATTALNDYMFDQALRILEAAATMYGCELQVVQMGAAQSASSDPALMARVSRLIEETEGLSVHEPEPGGGSEDVTYMMSRVQEQGGLAVNMGIGADLGGWGHHTAEFDFDERALKLAVQLLCRLALDLGREGERR